MTVRSELAWLDIASVLEVVGRREVRVIDVLESVLHRIDRFNPALNAYVSVMADAARAEAAAADAELSGGHHRPLHGVTIAVKDMIHVQGWTTTGGSRTLLSYIAPQDADCVARLRAAGALLIGKLHTHELAAGATSASEVFGQAKNPWNTNHVPGGSSGGSAIAIAAGLAHGTLGTDTLGSVRMPAAFCGVVGLKPTAGRISRQGVVMRSWTLDHVGLFTRRVCDAALLLQVLAGFDPNDAYASKRPVPDFSARLTTDLQGMRVGVLADAYFDDRLDSEIDAAFDAAVGVFDKLGCQTGAAPFPLAAAAQAASMLITFAEASSTQDEVLRSELSAHYGQDVRAALQLGELISARQYLRAMRVRPMVQQELGGLLRRFDVLVCPTTSVLPPRTEGIAPETSTRFARNTRPFSLAGLPALSVPAGFSREGLPIGLQIIGRPFDEATVLRVGHAYEAATPWHSLRPSDPA